MKKLKCFQKNVHNEGNNPVGTTDGKRTQMPMYISNFAPPKAQFLCLLDVLFKRLHFNKKGITSSFLIQLILNLNMWHLNLQLLFQIFEWRIINGPKQTREKKFLLVFLLKLWIIGYFFGFIWKMKVWIIEWSKIKKTTLHHFFRNIILSQNSIFVNYIGSYSKEENGT